MLAPLHIILCVGPATIDESNHMAGFNAMFVDTSPKYHQNSQEIARLSDMIRLIDETKHQIAPPVLPVPYPLGSINRLDVGGTNAAFFASGRSRNLGF